MIRSCLYACNIWEGRLQVKKISGRKAMPAMLKRVPIFIQLPGMDWPVAVQSVRFEYQSVIRYPFSRKSRRHATTTDGS